MNFFEWILSNPIYILLFGSGGILAIIISIIAVVLQIRKGKNRRGIYVAKSKKTSITNNDMRNQSIEVKESDNTNISENKG